MNYTMKQISKQLNLNASALRYYDKEGLLPFQKRFASGIRFFDDNDICWLELICCLKGSGMPIKTIKQFMLLCLKGKNGCEERKELLQKHKENIQQQIECLQNDLCMMNYKLEHYQEIGIFNIDGHIK